ncbi:MAG: hypothetical protein L0Y44_02055 [Phycisphaerales bacterium]|nr:hypothetical protein [Phycisphaerales bacterium]MCI0629421.1 hypothetical protein [Phycisphaerales bacterium]MCI0675564.1 hypothetical protein [Phycisphaerales bacterium]
MTRCLYIKWFGLCALCLAFALGGCSAQHRQVSSTQPRSPASPGYYLKYVAWSGVSPGAGFTSTSLHVVEVDLGAKRARRLNKSASAPEPMLPHDEKGISELARSVDWVSLSPEHAERFEKLTEMWLGTKPPARYNDPKGLGREDGYHESLSVEWATDSVSTEINPRAGFTPDDPLRPPNEWRQLILALRPLEPSRRPSSS